MHESALWKFDMKLSLSQKRSQNGEDLVSTRTFKFNGLLLVAELDTVVEF